MQQLLREGCVQMLVMLLKEQFNYLQTLQLRNIHGQSGTLDESKLRSLSFFSAFIGDKICSLFKWLFSEPNFCFNMIFVIKFSASIFVTMISVRFAFGIYVCVCVLESQTTAFLLLVVCILFSPFG